MSDESPVSIGTHAIVESARLTRRSEEGARVFAQVSFPVDGNQHLLSLLAGNLKNPIEITVTQVQASLWDAGDEEEPDAVTESMYVNGADDQPVRRPRGRKKQQPADDENKPMAHVFKRDADDQTRCGICHMGETADVHVLTQQAADLINEAQPDPEPETVSTK